MRRDEGRPPPTVGRGSRTDVHRRGAGDEEQRATDGARATHGGGRPRRAARRRGPAILALALAGAVALWPRPAEAQESPEALVEASVESARAEDRAGLRALVHPTVLESLPEARVRGAVDSWLDPDVPEGYELRVKTPDDVEAYDPETRTYELGGLPLRFPVAPDRFFEIVVARRDPGQAGGEGPQGAVTGPEVVHAAARHEGRWYFVLPGAPSP